MRLTKEKADKIQKQVLTACTKFKKIGWRIVKGTFGNGQDKTCCPLSASLGLVEEEHLDVISKIAKKFHLTRAQVWQILFGIDGKYANDDQRPCVKLGFSIASKLWK